MKLPVSLLLALVAFVLALGLFLFGCFAAASDAQGAILFIVVGPATLGLLAGGVVLSIVGRKGHARMAATSGALSGIALLVVVAFFVGAFLPSLRWIPEGIMAGVASGYEAVTGQTPYEAVR
jgi:hypothetical protein